MGLRRAALPLREERVMTRRPAIETGPAKENVVRTGGDWLVSHALDRHSFIADADSRMAALLALYSERCRGLSPPQVSDLDLEGVFATGMLAHTYRLDVGGALDAAGLAVWPRIRPMPEKGTALLRRLREVDSTSLIAKALHEALPAIVLFGWPAFRRLAGHEEGVSRQFDVAVLPLCNDAGQVAQCLVPVRNRTHARPADRPVRPLDPARQPGRPAAD